MILRPRKLLAAAPFLAAALAGCGTTAAPAARATVVRAPVTAPAPAATPPAAVIEVVPVAAVAATPVAAPMAATPMCDGRGRPLSGNVRTKGPERECSTFEILAAARNPETE